MNKNLSSYVLGVILILFGAIFCYSHIRVTAKKIDFESEADVARKKVIHRPECGCARCKKSENPVL